MNLINIPVSAISVNSSLAEFQSYALQNWTKPVRTSYLNIPGTGRAFGYGRSGRQHAALDYVVADGTPVYAMTGGTVVEYSPNFYGGTQAIGVKNDDGSVARYCEIATSKRVGSRVEQGEQIGTMKKNNIGGSSMLHLELYRGTASGSLTNTSNTTYDYVSGSFKRRRDLLDPTFLLQLSDELHYNPEGYIDGSEGGAGTVHVAGWAFDRDTPDSPIDIHVYVDGPAGTGTGMGAGTANLHRPDVAAVCGVGEYHGYDFTMSTGLTGNHTIYIYAVSSATEHTLLGTQDVYIYPEGAMTGLRNNIEWAEGGKGTISIGGWAYDANNPGDSLEIHVYIGGPAGSGVPFCGGGTADTYRPDVNNAFGVGEYHGFGTTRNVPVTGDTTLYIYAVNPSKNTNAFMGTRDVHIEDAYKFNLEEIKFENNILSTYGWAICDEDNENFKIVMCVDDMPEVPVTRYTRNDVHRAFPAYPASNEGFSLSINGEDMCNGQHTAILRAYYNDYSVELGRLNFTSNSDHKPKKTIIKNNHIYSIYDVRMDWMSAEAMAENKGGHLIIITSQEEQTIVKELLEYGNLAQYWIGCNSAVDGEENERLGDWIWVTGEQFNYSNWHEGEPNNGNGAGNEFYGGVYSNGTWNDFSKNAKNIGYIMETEISGEPAASTEKDGHYYYLYDNEVDWHGAKAFCEAMGGYLMTITDSKEQAIAEELKSKGSSDFEGYFIGAVNKDDGKTWKWVTGEDWSYTNWDDSQPDTFNGTEHYAEIWKAGKWNDRDSYNNGSKDGFILEIEKDDTYTAKEEYNGNTYLRIDKSLSWEDAKKYCELLGGHLATIADEDEQEVIEDLLSRGVDTLRSAYALGGTDADSEGNWKWITDEPFNYENWDNGEPNNGSTNPRGEQNYLSIYAKSDAFGLWDDNWNFSENPYDIGFICEIEGDKTEPIEPTTEPIVVPDPIIETPAPSDEPVIIDDRLSTVTVETVNAEGGSTVTIPVSISNNQGICESKFVVQYDNTRLTPKQVTIGEGFNGGSLTTNIENITAEKNSLTVTWENNSIADNVNNGEMFSVVFDVAENAAPGVVPITIDKNSLEVINANGDDISINIVSGGAAIAWPIISVGNVTASVGGTVTVPVRIENNTGINAFGFTLEYDNQVVTPIEVTTGNITDGKGSIQSNLQDTSIDWSQQHEVTASWLSDDLVNDISEDGVLFNVKFKIKDNVETGYYVVKLNYTDGDITNAAGAEIGVTTASGGVSVEEAKIMYGDVNCDGKVNIIDIVLLRKYYADLPVDISDDGLSAGDVNLDGKIDSRDILQMRKYVAKWNGIVLGK